MSRRSPIRCGRAALALTLGTLLALTPELAWAAPAEAAPAGPAPAQTPVPEPAGVEPPAPGLPTSELPAPGVPAPELPAPELPAPGIPATAPSAGGEDAFEPPPPPGPAPTPEELEGELGSLTFPDPGVAPDDGMSMLVLSTTTIGLTLAGATAGLVIGLNQDVPLDGLLPSTLVPALGLLAFAGGGLYLGIKRRRGYRSWAAGYRVIGTPQGKGLNVGASLALLGALAFIPSGAYAISEDDLQLGVPLLVIGGIAALATPTMFVVSAQRRRNLELTGGWRRRVMPPRPGPPRPGPPGARLELQPSFTLLPGGGVGVGLAGRF